MANTFIGPDVGQIFNVTGGDAGTVGTTSFTQVGNLTGGTGADSFVLSGGTLSGAINGGLGSNTLAGSTTYVVTGADSGTAAGRTRRCTQGGHLSGTARGEHHPPPAR